MVRRGVAGHVGVFVVLHLLAFSLHAQSTAQVTKAVDWLNGKQNANGSWGAEADLGSQYTARVLIAQALHGASGSSITGGQSWLRGQLGLTANQFLAEQVLALNAGGLDVTPFLQKLARQRSATGQEFGGFAEHTGDTLDSAVSLEALALNEPLYRTTVAGLVTSLMVRQNADGGWGMDRGFESDPIITAEVLVAMSATAQQLAPQATLDAGQQYLLRRKLPDGSIGPSALETATAFRALAVSGADLSSFATATLGFLRVAQSANGSWNDDIYTTARVLEAFAAEKPNFVVQSAGFSLTPSTAAQSTSVTASLTIRNSGAITSPASVLSLFVGDAGGRKLVDAAVPSLAAGATQQIQASFTVSQMQGTQTIVAAVDPNATIAETNEKDNTASAVLDVVPRADLRVFATGISVTPATPFPNQPATLAVSIRNDGGTAATNVVYSISDIAGTETLLRRDAVTEIAAGSAALITMPVTLAGGAHSIRVIVDPDNSIAETDETNNRASKAVTVAPAAAVDLRVVSIVSNPARPAAGTSITLTAVVRNDGTDPVQSVLALYDGVPGAGGVLISTAPLGLDMQSDATVTATYTTGPQSRVIYAVADPDQIVPEMNELNNQGFVALTDQYADLAMDRDGVVMSRLFGSNAVASARIVVRNLGSLPAGNVRLVVHDDLPQSGGAVISDSVISVPSFGKVVVPVSWTVRGGQRFLTANVNPSAALFEPDYANNRVTKYYVSNGSSSDSTLLDVDPSQIVIGAGLTISGVARVRFTTGTLGQPFLVLVFEDADGDSAYNPEVDRPLGSVSYTANVSGDFSADVPLSGTVRFAPGKLMAYVDATNAFADQFETNNLRSVWPACSAAAPASTPSVKWSASIDTSQLPAVARLYDTNGDNLADDFDMPVVVGAAGGSITLLRGDNGQVLWTRHLDNANRQISPAVGDLDGDGKAEIIAHFNDQNDHKLVALDNDGTLEWTTVPLDRDPLWDFFQYSYGGAPLIADLDQDGFPEVVTGRTCLDGRTGAIKWVGAGGAGRNFDHSGATDPYAQFFPDQEAPIAVDLTGDRRLEVVAGNTAYRSDGTILWQRSDLPDGYTAPVYTTFPPQICLVGAGNVWLLRGTDGATLWGPVAIPNGALLGGAPTYFSGFIGVAGDNFYTVFNASNGSVRWTKRVSEDPAPGQPGFGVPPTHTNAAVWFNFGTGEVLVYASRDKLLLMRTTDGFFVYQTPIVNRAFFPASPAVADVDDDGHADIVVPGTTLQVLSSTTWNDTFSVYNEFSYHRSNVSSESAAIPRIEPDLFFARLGFRLNEWFAAAAFPLPNLSASFMRVDSRAYPASASIIARIGNFGTAPAGASTVAFYRLSSGVSTLLGTAGCPALAPGEYADVSFVVSAPPAGFATYYAVADSNGVIAECNESDNRSLDVTTRFASDVILNQATILVSDPRPRIGDTVHFAATALITGSVPAGSLAARFHLGDPAAGGVPISPDIPATITTERLQMSGSVGFDWLVSAPEGPASIYVVFDPANAIAEDDETNNSAIYSLNVSSAGPQKQLAATLTLTPPSAERATPITIEALLQNIGNVALDSLQLRYDVTGPSAFQGTVTLAPLGKDDLATLTVGTFTPSSDGVYSVALTAADPAVAIAGGAATITVGPFATAAQLTATPSRVPLSRPIVQVHTTISRTNTVVPPDPALMNLIKASLRLGAQWQAQVAPLRLNQGCYLCHAHSQPLIALEETRKVSDVTIDDKVSRSVYDEIVKYANPGGLSTGHIATSSAAWAVSTWRDPVEARPVLTRLADMLLKLQDADGGFTSDDTRASFAGREAATMMSMIATARAFSATGDPRYDLALRRMVGWALAYDYKTVSPVTPEYPARVAIGLGEAVEHAGDPALAASMKARVRDIALYLRGLQNSDGTFGAAFRPVVPVVQTAQCLYAISLADTPPADPVLRKAIVWLLNHQRSNGGWFEGDAPDQFSPGWIDESTWAMIAIPAAFERFGQLDVDLSVTIPSSTALAASNVAPLSARAVTGGTEITWRVHDPSGSGQELFFELQLNALANEQTQPVATAASLSYDDPNSHQRVTRSLGIPSVTGYSPLAVTLSTDKPAYTANENVIVTETVRNLGAPAGNLTHEVSIRDAAGTTAATLLADTLADLPSSRFPGWNFKVIARATAPEGTGRHAAVAADFAALLAQAGAAGTFDRNSIRVAAEGAASPELSFTWYGGTAGTLAVMLPDSVAAGTLFDFGIYFDSAANGLKPVSLYDRSLTQVNSGQAFSAQYFALSASSPPFATDPAQLVFVQPARLVVAEKTTTLRSEVSAQLPANFGGIWSGSFFAPVTGSYLFVLGSDDGTWLDIDGTRLINNGSLHNYLEISNTISLAAGFHTFKVTINNYNGASAINLKWAPPASQLALIPQSNLYPAAPVSAFLTGAAAALPQPSVTRTLTWNSGTSAAGPYSAVAAIRQGTTPVAGASSPFTIAPSTQIDSALSTDKVAYDAGEIAHVTANVQYVAGNVTIANATAIVSVVNSSGATLATAATPIASLAPGQSAVARLDWSISTSNPGTYTASVSVRDSAGQTLVQKSVPFEVRSSAVTGKGIAGTITVPAAVYRSEPLPISVTVTNGGNAPLANAPFEVRFVDAQQSPAGAVPLTVTAAPGATVAQSLQQPTSGMTPGTYDAHLVSLITGQPASLASARIRIKAMPQITATVAAARSSYDVGDSVELSASAQFVSGEEPLINPTLTVAIVSPSGTTAATQTTTLTSFAPGQTAPATLTWPVGTSAPGTYSAQFTVNDASGLQFAQATATFAIISTAVSGKGITGTIATPASVTQGTNLPVTVTITNNGNAPLIGAPFAVTVAGDTIPFTASVPIGATVTSQLSEPTSALIDQTYTAALLSTITTPPVSLATTTFAVLVQAPAVSSFSATPAAISAGEPVTLSWTTVNATSVSISGVGPSQPANGSVVVSPAATTTYVLTATGPSGSATASVTVTVRPSVPSSIAANFNGTALAAGNFIWFSAVCKVTGLPATRTTIFVTSQTITFTANGSNYNLTIPNSQITFHDDTVTEPVTTFDAASNTLKTRLPGGPLSGNTLLSGFPFPVPAGGLPGGIKDVTWPARFATDSATALSLNWQWAAAVYTSFSSDANALGIKPVDVSIPQYPNSDHAGTPENYKSFVTGGARGGGGSNYTGSHSGTASVTVPAGQ